jgi:hypothetical protein
MDLESTLEETVQESEVSKSDSSSNWTTIGRSNRAFCKEFEGRFRELGIRSVDEALDSSISCGCALCRLYCTMNCLTRIGPALWRMDPGEVNTWLLEFEKKSHSGRIGCTIGRRVCTIYNSETGRDAIRFFQIEGMRHLRIQRKPLLILSQHIHPWESYLFSNHFLVLLVLIRASSLRRGGWNTV